MADHGKKKRSFLSAVLGVFTGSGRKAKILDGPKKEKKKEKKKKKGKTLREKIEERNRRIREAAKD